MDEPLPVLKDFQAEAAPPETPDPWWKRYVAYAFFTVALTVGFAGADLYENVNYPLRHRLATTPPGDWFKFELIGSAILGLVSGIGISVTYELGVRRKGKTDAAGDN